MIKMSNLIIHGKNGVTLTKLNRLPVSGSVLRLRTLTKEPKMMRSSGEGGATRRQGGCKYVSKMKEEEFLGRQKGLKKAIFECDKPEHAAQFIATLKELALYEEREYKGGEDIGYIFRELKDVQVLLHLKLVPEADEYDTLIWQE